MTTLNVFFFSKMTKGTKKRKNLWNCMAGKVVRDKKLEEYENENYYFLWWSDKRHFPYNSLGLTDEDNSVSRTDNFVNVNVFSSVTSPRVLSYRCVLHYFLTMPVGFNFNSTDWNLKSVTSKLSCLQTIHFPSSVVKSHFDYSWHCYRYEPWIQ